MDKFRVALSGGFKRPDGDLAFPDFDLAPLRDHPAVELGFISREPAVRAAEIEDVDALVLLTTRFDESSLPKSGRLALIARFGVGFDTVDLELCARHGIAVVTTPDGVRRPVAVAILTLLLALSTRLLDKHRLACEGPEGWLRRTEATGTGLLGRTLGLIGMGNIGAEFLRLAAPLGMRLTAHDPHVDPARFGELGVAPVALDALFAKSDFVVVCCPLNEATRGLVSRERIAAMKPSAYLINTARGPIVDQTALTEALAARRIAGAGLDVFALEPVPADEPLLALNNVVLAPHALAFTDQSMAGIGACDTDAILSVIEGEVPRGIINRAVLDAPRWSARLADYRARFGG